jgi:hypothetical protein
MSIKSVSSCNGVPSNDGGERTKVADGFAAKLSDLREKSDAGKPDAGISRGGSGCRPKRARNPEVPPQRTASQPQVPPPADRPMFNPMFKKVGDVAILVTPKPPVQDIRSTEILAPVMPDAPVAAEPAAPPAASLVAVPEGDTQTPPGAQTLTGAPVEANSDMAPAKPVNLSPPTELYIAGPPVGTFPTTGPMKTQPLGDIPTTSPVSVPVRKELNTIAKALTRVMGSGAEFTNKQAGVVATTLNSYAGVLSSGRTSTRGEGGDKSAVALGALVKEIADQLKAASSSGQPITQEFISNVISKLQDLASKLP